VLFGPFRFDLSDRTLTRDGQEVRLPPRALLILAHLLERPNRIVSKRELIDTVWKDAFVGETSLTEAVGVLRQALGDAASDSTYIQTVHRRGYRFVAPLRFEAQTTPVLTPVSTFEPSATGTAPTAVLHHRALATRPLGIAIALLVLVIAAVAMWLVFGRQAPPQVTRATITLPVSQAPAPGLTAQPVATLSPDGRRIVYVAGAPGSYRLFLRSIDQFEAIAIPATDGAHGAFFSPDGASIGFFARGRLFVLRLPDGEPIDLAPSGAGVGGWWHTDESIVYATGTGGLFRIPARGGTPAAVPVNGVDAAMLRHPTVLADGRTLLATHWKFNVRHSEIVAIDMETASARVIGRGVHARALPGGRVAYLRDNDLVAVPLSGQGPEVVLISGVMTGVTGSGQYSVAANGTLLYLPDVPSRLVRQMAIVTFEGVEQPLPFETRAFQNVALSPDGRSVATTIYERGASDLWIGDIERGVLQRLSSEGGNVDPVWSRDGMWIYFASTRAGQAQIYRMPSDGSAGPTVVSSVTSLSPSAPTSSGLLFAMRLHRGGSTDIVTVAQDGTVRDWLATPAQESGARVSPDERQVVYHSGRSGNSEVYVRAMAGDGAEMQVSIKGGSHPGWSRDGRSIYFMNERRLFRVEMRSGTLTRPEEIYAGDRLLLARIGEAGILVLKAIEEERPLTTINIVVGWTDEVRARQR
jgi:DNA-binding winged helix-turn-helix (wHTH) protein/Tol biopolymer transport system component